MGRVRRLAMAIGLLACLQVLSVPAAQADVDCSDFGSQADAQRYLVMHPLDVAGLDGDNDGRACEWNGGGGTNWGLVAFAIGAACVGLYLFEDHLRRRAKRQAVQEREARERAPYLEAEVAATAARVEVLRQELVERATCSFDDLYQALSMDGASRDRSERLALVNRYAEVHALEPNEVMELVQERADWRGDRDLDRFARSGFGDFEILVAHAFCDCVRQVVLCEYDWAGTWVCSNCGAAVE